MTSTDDIMKNNNSNIHHPTTVVTMVNKNNQEEDGRRVLSSSSTSINKNKKNKPTSTSSSSASSTTLFIRRFIGKHGDSIISEKPIRYANNVSYMKRKLLFGHLKPTTRRIVDEERISLVNEFIYQTKMATITKGVKVVGKEMDDSDDDEEAAEVAAPTVGMVTTAAAASESAQQALETLMKLETQYSTYFHLVGDYAELALWKLKNRSSSVDDNDTNAEQHANTVLRKRRIQRYRTITIIYCISLFISFLCELLVLAVPATVVFVLAILSIHQRERNASQIVDELYWIALSSSSSSLSAASSTSCQPYPSLGLADEDDNHKGNKVQEGDEDPKRLQLTLDATETESTESSSDDYNMKSIEMA